MLFLQCPFLWVQFRYPGFFFFSCSVGTTDKTWRATAFALPTTAGSSIEHAIKGDFNALDELAGLGQNVLFGLVMSGWDGEGKEEGKLPDVNKKVTEEETYADPENGDKIVVPKGKSLAEVDPETAEFYSEATDKIKEAETNTWEDITLNDTGLKEPETTEEEIPEQPTQEVKPEDTIFNAIDSLDKQGFDTTEASNANFDWLTAMKDAKTDAFNKAIEETTKSIDNAIEAQKAKGFNTAELEGLRAEVQRLSETKGIMAPTAVNSEPQNAGDQYIEYANSIGTNDMPSLDNFIKMREEGGGTWNELTLKKSFNDAVKKNEVSRFADLDEYKATSDYIKNNAPELAYKYSGDIEAAINDVTNKVHEMGKTPEEVVERIKGNIDNTSIKADNNKVDNTNLKNIKEYIAGNKTFDNVIDDYSKVYADKVNSNEDWSWNKSFDEGDKLSLKQKRMIKEQAIKNGYIPDVKVTKTGSMRYGFADFDSAGIVKKIIYLPRDIWRLSDNEQFEWLDRKNGGHVDGYTWHHTEIPGKMELVPTGIHNITTHNGGRTTGMWADAPR